MSRQWLAGILAAAAAIGPMAPALADEAADRAAIVQRLERWTAAFNARDSKGVCDLFAPDLRYSVPEVLQGTRESMCGNLEKVLSRTDIRVRYDNPDIHEIIVDGDVVRLTWALTTEMNGDKDTTTEEGMDFFRRQPDGRWSIARYIAFPTRPNKLLR